LQHLIYKYNIISKKNLLCFGTSLVFLSGVFHPNPSFAKDKADFYLKYSNAVKNEKEGNRLKAVKSYREAYELDRRDFGTLMKLGLMHLNSDAKAEVKKDSIKLALDYFTKARALKPDDTLANLMLGKSFEELGKTQEAIKYFVAAANLEPNNVLLKENLGRIYFENKDFKNAIEVFNKIVMAYPDNLKARSYLGAALQSTDNYLSAIEQYNYVLNYTPDEYSIVKNIGDSWLAINQLDKASESYAKALEIDPNVPNLHADLAFISRQREDFATAIDSYKKALKFKYNPEWQRGLAYSYWANKQELEAIYAFDKVEDYSISGFIYQTLGQLDEAISSYEKAIEINPKDHKVRFNLAQIYHSQNDLINASKEYEALLEQKPNDSEVIFLLASIKHEQGDIDAAMAYYDDIIRLDNKDGNPELQLIKSNSSYNMGLAYKSQHKLEQAEESFEGLISSSAEKVGFTKTRDVYKELSFIKIALGKDVEAERIINSWLKEDPTSIEARNLYADFLVHVAKERQAIEQLRLAATLDRTSETRLKLANLLHAQNSLYEALAEYQTVLQAQPDNLNALLGAANNFKALGFKEEAINMYKTTLDKYPDDILANYNYGILMQESKELDLAKFHYKRVLELNPKFTQAYYVLGLAEWDSGNKDKAKESWNKFMNISTDETLKQAIKNILNNSSNTNPNIETPTEDDELGNDKLSFRVDTVRLIEVN
jgi:tetratricopeptide (TPR) repeat protein